MKKLTIMFVLAALVGCKTLEVVNEDGSTTKKTVLDLGAVEDGISAATALVPPPWNLVAQGGGALVLIGLRHMMKKKEATK